MVHVVDYPGKTIRVVYIIRVCHFQMMCSGLLQKLRIWHRIKMGPRFLEDKRDCNVEAENNGVVNAYLWLCS